MRFAPVQPRSVSFRHSGGQPWPRAIATFLLCMSGLLSGCVAHKKTSLAIAISPTGQRSASAAQLAEATATLTAEVTKRGFVVTGDTARADYVVFARFTPDPVSPSGGHLDVVAVQKRSAEKHPAELAELRSDASAVAREILQAAATPQ